MARKRGYIKVDEVKNQMQENISEEDTNPFSSYLFPLVKVSSLYRIKEDTETAYESGKITKQDYTNKINWLIKEINRKTGTSYDDTKLNLNFDESK